MEWGAGYYFNVVCVRGFVVDAGGMTVTIEVASQAGGMGAVKRTFLLSENFATAEELERAAVQFIRDSRTANEEALEGFSPSAVEAGR